MASCAYCFNQYDLIDGFGTHCSRRCAVRHGNKNIWSDEELNHLKSLVGSNPVAKIINDWNAIAVRKGWIERSPNSIKIKAVRLFKGASTKAKDDNLSFTTWSKRLNIAVDRFQDWELCGLKVENYSKDAGGRSHIKCVSRQSLTEFARIHPEKLWGISKNNLEKSLIDKALAKALFKSVNQPTVGRPIAIVDLKHCAVYPSAKNAASVLDLHKSTILHNAKISPHPYSKNLKHNFAQLDYPVWWISREHASVMHEIAGVVLYEMHSEYVEVDGYTKQRFLTLGVAIAVRIAIRSLNIYFHEHKAIPETNSGIVKEIATRIRKVSDSFQQRFVDRDSSQCFEIIKRTIKGSTAHIFHGRVLDKRKIDIYLEEFANDYIEFAAKFFKRRQYLPKDWKPKTSIEKAYYWDSILGVVYIKREIGRSTEESKMILIRVLMAYQFIQKKGLEFSSVERNENYLSHQTAESNASLFEEELANFIEANSQNKYLQSILFAIAHGFSDKEIAMQLALSKDRYFEYKTQLQDLTKLLSGRLVVGKPC
ncbi:hypothetical protein [Nostoc sp. TCL240-02]|uniref:hypothetical protein n=1 Tax=Nostoc sp. TCL240-02 TaxID=2572090 RepID=UPI00157FABE7|nr:hypothetical protein [Nostoc sp. TCL240-02]QKQ76577.1 hypothetical protein FBB35_27695 [Nostoc sp. TCL240-02]